jgi:ABC-type transport system involved in multi-copper enzyme maturation permease subunit
MNRLAHLWRIASRELTARWILIPAAVILGTLAMLAIRSLDLNRGGADGMLTGTWVATLVISAIVGMSLLGEELSNGRLSFYFVRPFAPSTIFGGKLLAGIILALVIQSLVIALVAIGLPAIAWVDSSLAARGLAAVIGERVLATFACVVLGMAAGIVLQSRTRWFILDVACVAVVGVASAWVVLHVTRTMHYGHSGDVDVPAGYDDQVTVLQIAALAVGVLGLAIATARALARGRTDRERAHAALSTTLWPIVVPSAALMLAATIAWL